MTPTVTEQRSDQETARREPAVRGRRSFAAAVRTGRGHLLPLRVVLLALACLLVVVLGTGSTPVLRYGLVLGMVYAVAILGSNALTSTLGEISLAQGAFMAVGAYACVVLLDDGWPLAGALLASTLLAAVTGAVLAIPMIRLEGIFTALVTFALTFAVPGLILQLDDVTGGQAGIPAPYDVTVAGEPVGGSGTGWLVFVTGVFFVCGLLFLLLLHGSTGRRLVTIGEGGAAAACFGMRVRVWQVAVWCAAAALGGLAGALFGLTVGFLTPELFPIMLSILVLVGTVLGGARSALGALLGGLFIGAVPPQLQSFIPPETTGMLFGGAFLLVLLTGMGGVNGLVERTAGLLRRRGRRTPAVPSATTTGEPR